MQDYLLFAFAMLVGQLSPGPDMLLILKNSFNHNLRAALFTIFGIITGIVFHTTVAITGLSVLFARSGVLYQVMKYAGAIYLAYLGSRLILTLFKKGEDTGDSPTHGKGGRTLTDGKAFTQGLLTNLLNPKVIIIISSVLLAFLGTDSTLPERITYGVILVVEGFVVWVLFALLLQTPPAKRQFLRWETPINATFGVLLIGLAIRALFFR